MDIITIIVCTYNQEDTIHRCLDAILSQRSPWPFEVVIGEDGGTDNTRAICKEYVRMFPNIVRLMPKAQNKGILQNYFDCVRAAKGKYIMECGGDDEWMPGRIQTCLDIMEAHPDIGMVLTPYITKEEVTGNEYPINPAPWHEGIYPGEELSYRRACATVCSPGAFAMTRLSMLKKAMNRWPQFFNGRKFLMEDMQMAVTMGQMGKMYYHEQPTYYYYVGGSNISLGDNERKRFRFEKNALELLVALTRDIPLDKEKVIPAMEYRIYVILMHCFRLHDKESRNSILSLSKELAIPLLIKSKILEFITSNPITWTLMLGIRKMVLTLKRIL